MDTDEILKWINLTGFPLEMEAADAFREAGFYVRQSGTFPDPQSEKGREIDVLAEDPDLMGILNISFVVECKSSSKPWVVLTSNDALASYSRIHAFGLTSNHAKDALFSKYPNLGRLSEYVEKPNKSGYGFRQAFSKDSDPAYTAAMSVIKACHEISKDRPEQKIPKLTFSFPVIVVNSPLFECSRKRNGELAVKEVLESEFLFSAHIPNPVSCQIKIVTRKSLGAFAMYARNMATTIRMELDAEEDKIFERHRSPPMS